MALTDLHQAYCHTTYRVDHPGGAFGIRIGHTCPPLNALLAAHAVTRWALVTAWNPQSVKLSLKNNKLRNISLRDAVARSGYTMFYGRGVPDSGGWEPEESLLILGIAGPEAVALGRRHGQHAIVLGVAGGCAELRWCAGDGSDRMPA